MGWKTFKEYFQIDNHIVQITKEGLCIGSNYCSNLATVNIETGEVFESKVFSGFLRNYYPKILEAKRSEILLLINTQDKFDRSIPVYTYNGGEIIEKFCENTDWPNVTHDGCLMYSNTHSTSKLDVVLMAKENNQARIENYLSLIKNAEEKLKKHREILFECQQIKYKLDSFT